MDEVLRPNCLPRDLSKLALIQSIAPVDAYPIALDLNVSKVLKDYSAVAMLYG